MASSPKSSLATLLIISAIDLLLCSFTMGAMLFLIFQPSQRNDRGSAITRHSAGSRSEIQSIASGARDSPAVIVIENLSQNRFATVDIPSGYRTIGSSKDPGRTLAFAAFIGDQPSSLTLESQRGNGKTEALISVAMGGNLFTQAVHCSSDADASVILGEKPAVEINCRSPPTLCSFGSFPEGLYSTDRKNIDRGNARIIFLGSNSAGTVRLPKGRVCVASPTLDNPQQEEWNLKISADFAAIAKDRCNAKIPPGFSLASPEEENCVFDAPDVVASEKWLIDCDREEITTLSKQSDDTAYILFVGDDGAGVCSQVDIVK